MIPSQQKSLLLLLNAAG